MELNYLNDINNLLLEKDKFSTNILPSGFKKSDEVFISRNENNYYLQFNFNTVPLPHQGFKIHVSATLKNYKKILDIIFNYCKNNNVCFKYISNTSNISKNLSGNAKVWSSGKFITIYPDNYYEFKKHINNLYRIKQLKNYEGIEVISDRRYKDSSIIYYRYGIITGPNMLIFNPNNKNDYYEDYKNLIYYIPNWVTEPFPKNIDDNKKSKILFNKYFPVRALNNKASGSTFIVEDNNKQKFILKNAKSGYMSGQNYETSIQLLQNEAKNLKRLSKFNFLPTYKDEFYEDKDYFLVESLVKGEDIDSFRADIRNNFVDSSKREATILRYKLIIVDLINKLEKLHQNKIFLGDISAKNILIDIDNNSVNFIDLAQSEFFSDINENYSFYRTPGFFDNRTPYLNLERQDNQQLGYLIISLFTRANMFLKIDTSGKMSYEFFDEYLSTYNLPKVYSNIVKKLLFSESVDLISLSETVLLSDNGNAIFHVKKEKISYKSILKKATLALQSAYIDRVTSENDSKIFKFDDNSDFIFNNNLNSLRYSYILNKNISKKKLFLELDKLENILHTVKNNKQAQQLKLGNILSLVYCCLKNAITKEQIQQIKDILCTIDKLYKVNKDSKFIGYKMTYSSSYLSPYLEDGSAGMLINFLLYRDITHSKLFDNNIKQIVDNLKTSFMPKTGGFSRGLLGIILSLNTYSKKFHDKKVIENITIMANRLPYYCLKLNNIAYLITSSFDRISLDIDEGNRGLTKILNALP